MTQNVTAGWSKPSPVKQRYVGEIYLTANQTAAYIKLSPGTLANWRSQGKGPPFIRVAGQIRYRRNAVDDWMIAHEST